MRNELRPERVRKCASLSSEFGANYEFLGLTTPPRCRLRPFQGLQKLRGRKVKSVEKCGDPENESVPSTKTVIVEVVAGKT